MVLFLVGILLNTSWRLRGQSAAALLVALLVVAPSARSEAGIIPRTSAEQAYLSGDHQRALELFEAEVEKARGERRLRLHLGEAAAAYRLRDYNHASQAYSGALLSRDPEVQQQAHFGLGNTQFYKGLAALSRDNAQTPATGSSMQTTILYWQDAIAHFEGVLALDCDDRLARENRDRVKKRLEDLLKEKKSQEQEQKEPDQNAADKSKSSNPDEPDTPPGNGDPENPDSSPPPRNTDEGQDPPDGDSPPTPPEEPGGSHSDPGGNESPRRPAPDLIPKPGESPEEYAHRILSENADFEGRPVPLRFRRLPRPEKDW